MLKEPASEVVTNTKLVEIKRQISFRRNMFTSVALLVKPHCLSLSYLFGNLRFYSFPLGLNNLPEPGSEVYQVGHSPAEPEYPPSSTLQRSLSWASSAYIIGSLTGWSSMKTILYPQPLMNPVRAIPNINVAIKRGIFLTVRLFVNFYLSPPGGNKVTISI